jgi:hypothetical protein
MDVERGQQQWVQRWLDALRDGSEGDKIAARMRLAHVCEERGMLEEAIALLERNLDAGAGNAETLRWLSRLYQEQGDEGRSLAAAVHASRRSSDPSPPGPPTIPEAPEGVLGSPRPRAVRRVMPYLVMLIGMSITVGVFVWAIAARRGP